MTEYHAPLRDMRFVLDELAGMAEVAGLPGYEEATPDLIEVVLGVPLLEPRAHALLNVRDNHRLAAGGMLFPWR